MTLDLPATRVAKIFGFADAGSYLQAAQNLIANGRSTPEWSWVLNLWPPGMVWLDGLVLKLSPLPFGVTIALITVLVWSIPLALLTWPFMKNPKWGIVVVVAELGIFATSPFQSWMFDEGLFYADGLAVALFLTGLLLIITRTRSEASLSFWIRDGIFAGVAFAASIYLRASYQLVPWALVIVAGLLWILVIVQRGRGSNRSNLSAQATMLSVSLLSVLLMLQPYASYNLETKGRVEFVSTQDLVYQHAWENPRTDKIPQWMLDGGSTIGCDLDPAECAKIHSEEARGQTPSSAELRGALVQAIVAHPLQFAGNRVSFVSRQWFADELDSYSHVETNFQSDPVSYASSDNLNPPQDLLYLGLLVAAIVASIRLAVRGRWSLLVIPLTAAALLAPFAIVHVEVRYLIPLKMIALLAPLLIVMAFSDRRTAEPTIGEKRTRLR